MGSIEQKIKKLLDKYNLSYERLGFGRNRQVFVIDEDLVIKIPRNEEGVHDNYWEESVYIRNKDDGIYAKCEVIHEDGIALLKMQRVKICSSTENLPDWVKFIDCQQVGYTNDGQLVAFDYGYY